MLIAVLMVEQPREELQNACQCAGNVVATAIALPHCHGRMVGADVLCHPVRVNFWDFFYCNGVL